MYSTVNGKKNKNDNIYEREAQEIQWLTLTVTTVGH